MTLSLSRPAAVYCILAQMGDRSCRLDWLLEVVVLNSRMPELDLRPVLGAWLDLKSELAHLVLIMPQIDHSTIRNSTNVPLAHDLARDFHCSITCARSEELQEILLSASLFSLQHVRK